MQKLLYLIAPCLGLLIAYVDSRPTWDDTGISVLAVLAASGGLGLLGPKRPWLWALAVGIWIPLYAILWTHNYGAVLALVFAFVGAYTGAALRLVLQKAVHQA